MPAQAKAQRGDEHGAAGEMTKFIMDRGQWKKLGGIKKVRQIDR